MMNLANSADMAPLFVGLHAKALLILLAAWLLHVCFRSAPAAARHTIWLCALGSIVVWPLAAAWVPTYTIEVPARTAERLGLAAQAPSAVAGAEVKHTATVRRGHPAASSDGGSVAAPAAPPVSTPAAGPRWWWSWSFVPLVWAVGAVLRLVWVGLQLKRTRSTMIGSVRTAPSSQQRVASVLSASLGIRRAVTVVHGSDHAVPCTWGLRRPVILLPASAAEWSPERLRIVLLHELAHVRRWDYGGYLLAELATALYWLNPLVWVARRRVQAERERACDDEVLGQGVRPVEYAEHLLALARAFHGARWQYGGTLLFAREISLKQRVRAILDEKPRRGHRGAMAGTGAVLLVLACAVPISAMRAAVAAPAADRIPGMHVVADAGVAVAASLDDLPVPAGAPVEMLTIPVFMPRVNPDGASYLWVEAEAAALDGAMRARTDGAASGSRYVSAATMEEYGSVRMRFAIDRPGRYRVWGRVRVHDRASNSFYISVDDGAESSWIVPAPHSGRTGEWVWHQAGSERGRGLRLELDAGTHELTIRAREAGARIDGLLLTSDAAYRPRGVSPLLPPADPVDVWIEAETAELTRPFRVDRSRSAEGRRYVRVAGRDDSRHRPPAAGRAVFTVHAARAAPHFIWARTWSDERDENSFWVRANDGPWIEWTDMDVDDEWEWSTVRDSGDRERALFHLNEGANTIEFAYRESGARLDRIVITNDPRLVPYRTGRSTRAGSGTGDRERDADMAAEEENR